jgi:hypothetical protein
MRPLTKDNQGTGGKDGKEAWENDGGPSSEGESFVLFPATVFCDGKAVYLTMEFLFGWSKMLRHIYIPPFFSPCLQTFGFELMMLNLILRRILVVSPLPVVKNLVENEKIAADARADRVTIWMHNTESKFPIFF